MMGEGRVRCRSENGARGVVLASGSGCVAGFEKGSSARCPGSDGHRPIGASIGAVNVSLLPCHGCRSATGSDRAPADARSSSAAGVWRGRSQTPSSRRLRSRGESSAGLSRLVPYERRRPCTRRSLCLTGKLAQAAAARSASVTWFPRTASYTRPIRAETRVLNSPRVCTPGRPRRGATHRRTCCSRAGRPWRPRVHLTERLY
jgi:hypothetical protein